MDPRDLHNMVNELGDLNSNLREIVSNMGKVGTTSKSMSMFFEATKKATTDINSKIQKETKNLARITLAEKLRKTTISKRGQMVAGLAKKEQKWVNKLLSQNLRSEKIQIQARIKNFKKEKREASMASNWAMKQDQKVLKTRIKGGKGIAKEEVKLSRFARQKISKYDYDLEQKSEQVKKKTHKGAIAGDIADIGGILGRPFKEKSLNPLRWVQTGFKTGGALKEASEGMQKWSTVLKGSKGGKKSTKKIAENIGDVLEDATSNIGKVKAGKISKKLSKVAGVGKGAGKGAGESFGKAAQGLGMLVKIVDALSMALGVLSKMNWIFALISAMSAIISTGIELDKFFKELNKTFLDMAGSTLGTGDMVKNMSNFNDAVFSLNRNLKLGLKPEDIQGMFKAMSGAGVVPTNLDKQAGGYGKVIEMVRKTNIDLGISFEEAGKTIGEQMMNLRDTFDKSRKSLQVMGFEATKAGVQSNKFYAAIENSVSALSFLGNFTKQASASLTAFMKQSGLSFKDASKAADEYMQVFEKMDWKQMQVAFAMAGPDLIKSMDQASKELIEEPLNGLKDRMKSLQKQLAATTEEGARKDLTKQMSDLGDQINALAIRSKGYADALKDYQRTGAVGRLQQYRDLLTGSLATTITSIMQRQGLGTKDFGGGNYTAILEMLKKGLGVSDTLMTAMTQEFENLDVNFDTLGQSLNNENVVKALKDNGKEQANKLETLITNAKAHKDDTRFLDELYDETRDMGKNQLHMGDDEATAFAGSIKQLVSTGGGADEIVSWLKDMSTDENKKTKKFDKPGLLQQGKIVQSTHKAALASEDGFEKMSKQDIDLIANTTSMPDYLEIAKQSLKYIAAEKTEDILKGIGRSVINIMSDVSILASDKRQQQQDKIDKILNQKTFLGSKSVKEQEENIAQEKFNLQKLKQTQAEQGDKVAPDVKAGLQKEIDAAQANINKLEAKAKKDVLDVANQHMPLFLGKTATQDYLNAATAAAENVAATKEQELYHPKSEAATADDVKKALNVGVKNTPAPTKANDLDVSKGGLALLARGDKVFNEAAAGVAGAKGSLIESILSKMGLFNTPMAKGKMGNQAGQYEINLGGIHINGNVEDPIVVRQVGDKLVDMVKQVVINYDREKQLKTG
jgi:hypothetical protein